MTANQRVLLNIVATYGRTLFGVLCGLFSTRWVLCALGKEDFGLYGLVGSMVVFLTFLNSYFAAALSRFYAFSIGQSKGSVNPRFALEESRKWFSFGLAVHILLPMLMITIGYPIGCWAIYSGKVGVPIERIESCIWLLRFLCVSSAVSMVNIPFSAMYTAKQYIAELTIYSFVQVVVRTGFIYWMTLHQANWLVPYGLAMCIISIVPQLLVCIRAVCIFEECRFSFRYLKLLGEFKKIITYVGWQIFGGIGYLARYPFVTVVINRWFNPVMTASFSLGVTVAGEAAALTGALSAAFTPAITTACGEGDLERMRKMAYRASKFGTLLTLFFAIPIALEISEILDIWLKDVPEAAEGICLIMLAVVVVDKLSLGHFIGANAMGRIGLFHFFRGLACLTAMPFAVIAAILFKNVFLVTLSVLFATIIAVLSNVWQARKCVGLSVQYWIFKIMIPMVLLLGITFSLGCIPKLFMQSSFYRVIITTLVTFISEIFLAWWLVLSFEEKEFLKRKVLSRLKKRLS